MMTRGEEGFVTFYGPKFKRNITSENKVKKYSFDVEFHWPVMQHSIKPVE